MCIHKEDVAFYGPDKFVLEPPFTSLWKPSGRRYGSLGDFNCHVLDFRGFPIKALGKFQSNIGIMPLYFLAEHQPTTLLEFCRTVIIFGEKELSRWLNLINNFLSPIAWWCDHSSEIYRTLMLSLVCRKRVTRMRKVEQVACISNLGFKCHHGFDRYGIMMEIYGDCH